MKRGTATAAVLIIIGCTTIACRRSPDPKTTEMQVVISLNLDERKGEADWYWTQFHLPRGGMLVAEEPDQKEWDKLHTADPSPGGMTSSRRVGSKVFYGRFCCGETIPERYVYLPTVAPFSERKTLLFFDPNGSVWVIPVPEAIRTPRKGEFVAAATKYYLE